MAANYLQAVIGLIICIGLILVVASLARKHKDQIEKIFSGNLFAEATAERRLKTIERLPLAPGHTAVILQKDGVEHFVILSPQSSLVVEPGKSSRKALSA